MDENTSLTIIVALAVVGLVTISIFSSCQNKEVESKKLQLQIEQVKAGIAK